MTSEKDTAARLFFDKIEIVADLFNFLLFNGEQIIKPGCLREVRTELLKIFHKNRYRLNKSIESDSECVTDNRFRDLLYQANMLTDGRINYLILGVELQSRSDKEMVMRIMEYDARTYIARLRKSRWLKRHDIPPVINLVINLGPHKWRHKTSLMQMYSSFDKRLLPFINDYRITVLELSDLHEKRGKLSCSELKAVVNFFCNRNNAVQLSHEMTEETPGVVLSKEAVDIINVCLGCNIVNEEEGGKIEMCKAVEQFKAMGRAEGRAEGRADEKHFIIRRMLLKKFAVKDICAATGVSTRTVRKIKMEAPV